MNIFQKTILNTLYYLSVFYQNGHTITKIYKSQIDFYNTVVAAAGCSYGVDCRNRVPSKLTFLLRGLILARPTQTFGCRAEHFTIYKPNISPGSSSSAGLLELFRVYLVWIYKKIRLLLNQKIKICCCIQKDLLHKYVKLDF